MANIIQKEVGYGYFYSTLELVSEVEGGRYSSFLSGLKDYSFIDSVKHQKNEPVIIDNYYSFTIEQFQSMCMCPCNGVEVFKSKKAKTISLVTITNRSKFNQILIKTNSNGIIMCVAISQKEPIF